MSDIIDRIAFGPGTGLNTDDSLLVMPKGDSRERRNVVVDDEGDYSLLTNIPPTLKAILDDPFSGTDEVIGFTEDLQENKAYYFLKNSVGYDRIIELSYTGINFNIRYVVGEDFGTNLSFSDFIDADVLSSTWLYFTDGVNIPRKLNIDEAVNFTASLTSIYTAFDDTQMNAVYEPPQARPKAQLGTDPSKSKSLLRYEQFQFAYSYVYEDNTETTLSPWSQMIYNTTPIFLRDTLGNFLLHEVTDSTSDGNQTINNNPHNIVLIEYSVPNKLVSKVNIYVKYGFDSDWLLYDSVEHSAAGDYVYSYYNDKNVTGVAQEEYALIPYYDSPITADTQEIINNSVLVYGQYKSTRDIVDLSSKISFSANLIDNSLFFGLSSLPSTATTFTYSSANMLGGQVVTTGGNDLFNFSNYGLYIQYPKAGATYDFEFTSNYGLDSVVYNKNTAEIQAALLEHSNAIRDYINDRAGVGSVSITGGPDPFVFTFTGVVGSITAELRSTANTVRTLKADSTYRCGLVFFDSNMRTPGVITSPEFDIETFPSVTSGTFFVNDTAMGVKLTVTDNSVPSWVKYWAIAITRNTSTNSFFSGVFAGLSAVSPDISYDATLKKYKIDINREVNDLHSEFPLYKNGIGTYTFEEGDRIKIIGYAIFGGIQLVSKKIWDFEIEEQNGNVITINYSDNSTGTGTFNDDMSTLSTAYSIIYEIYSPIKNNTNEFYFEVGDIQPISDYTIGDHYTSQGDVYIGVRLISSAGIGASTAQPYFSAVRQTVSDFDTQKNPNLGRPNLEQPSTNRGEKSSLIWGGRAIANTNINNINEFIESTNNRYLDDKFGKVIVISQMGEILQCCQERSVTSFYLGAEEGLQADNSETLVFSSGVMGQGRRLSGTLGCTVKTAFVNIGNKSFFFDKYSNSIIQYSSNGLFRLSTYKMETYFRDFTDDFRFAPASNNLFMGYDPIKKILFLTLKSSNSTYNRTIGFHVPSDRFISEYDFHPIFYGNVGSELLIFDSDGIPWKWNHFNGDRNTPLGTLLESSVKAHSNENAGDNKVFNSISVNSNQLWSAPNTGDVFIEGQSSSRIKSGQFEEQEGVFNASFLKDMFTQGSTANVADLYNGRDLRGKEITVNIRNTPSPATTNVVLQYVEISSNISK